MYLDSRQRKFGFLFSAATIAIVLLSSTARSAMARKLGSSDDVASLRRAAALEPSNAARHHWLGRIALFVEQDQQSAVRELEETTELNPWIVTYWLDLALAYKSVGDSSGESRALQNALHAEPKNLNAAFSEGAFYLSRGETASAMQRFRVVLENDPSDPVSVLDTCWRATHDIKAALEALPPQASSLHFRLLELMIRHDEVEAAGQVWDRLVLLPQPFDSGKPLAYVEWLIQMKQPAAARRAWDQVQLVTNPRKPEQQNLLVNAGFEDELQNAGFDWRFGNGGAVTFAQDEDESHSGKRSLAINYTGASIIDAGLMQMFTSEPGTQMHLTAFVRSKDLLASEHPRLRIEDSYSHTIVATGQPIEDSATWQPTSVDFTVPADSHLLAIRIVQGTSPSRIKGTLWVDDFNLSKVDAPPGPIPAH